MKNLIFLLLLTSCVSAPLRNYNLDRAEMTKIRDEMVASINSRHDDQLLPDDPKNQTAVNSHNILVEIRRSRKLDEVEKQYNKVMQAIYESEVADANYRGAQIQAWTNFGNRVNQINTQNQLNRLEQNQRNQNYQIEQIQYNQRPRSGILMPSK